MPWQGEGHEAAGGEAIPGLGCRSGAASSSSQPSLDFVGKMKTFHTSIDILVPLQWYLSAPCATDYHRSLGVLIVMHLCHACQAVPATLYIKGPAIFPPCMQDFHLVTAQKEVSKSSTGCTTRMSMPRWGCGAPSALLTRQTAQSAVQSCTAPSWTSLHGCRQSWVGHTAMPSQGNLQST